MKWFWRFVLLIVVLSIWDACFPKDDESVAVDRDRVEVASTLPQTQNGRYCAALDNVREFDSRDLSAYVAEGWTDAEWAEYEQLVTVYLAAIPSEFAVDVKAIRAQLPLPRADDPEGWTPAQVAENFRAGQEGAQRLFQYAAAACTIFTTDAVGVISTYDDRVKDRAASGG